VKQWERERPLSQKFTKTDLAKFENTWDGLPHLVSRGAEKNFAHWTASREDSDWPAVDEECFRRLVAKGLLFRRTEQIVSAQDYPGYRANVVTYALAWLVRRSGRRINLDDIWRFQALPKKLSVAIDGVARIARQHIINPPGGRNITEWCKKEDCWRVFRDKEIALPKGWEDELANEPMSEPESEGDVLAQRWETIRQRFINDARTVGELAVRSKIKWPSTRSQDLISSYASLSWNEFQNKPSFGLSRQRAILQILNASLGK
jgi:hypothetical protein